MGWSVCAAPMPGEVDSGDRHVVAAWEGRVLLGVIDGLGHGEPAAAAAATAAEVLAAWQGAALEELVRQCHERLRGSRGVVLSLAVADPGAATLTWLGIGNVEGVLLRAGLTGRQARESLLLRSGVVGYQIPRLLQAARTLPLAPGDLLALATDGIDHAFAEALKLHDPPEENTRRIFERYRKKTDDALVLVASHRGQAA